MSKARHTIKEQVIETLTIAIDAGERAGADVIPVPIAHYTKHYRLGYKGGVMFSWLASNGYRTIIARNYHRTLQGIHGNKRIIILKGRERAIADLERHMSKAAQSEDYTTAALIRDRIIAIRGATPPSIHTIPQVRYEDSRT